LAESAKRVWVALQFSSQDLRSIGDTMKVEGKVTRTVVERWVRMMACDTLKAQRSEGAEMVDGS
jgi:hypothetical protein